MKKKVLICLAAVGSFFCAAMGTMVYYASRRIREEEMCCEEGDAVEEESIPMDEQDTASANSAQDE